MYSKGVFILKIIDNIFLVLLIVGGINWGLIGFFNFNLVGSVFGAYSFLSRVIYSLVGISAIYSITLLFKHD